MFSSSRVQVFARHGTAPSYLADELENTADFGARGRLRSASSLLLNVRRARLSTVRWRSGLPCCCCAYLEQSAATRHVRTLIGVARGGPRIPKGVEKNLYNRFSYAKGTNIM